MLWHLVRRCCYTSPLYTDPIGVQWAVGTISRNLEFTTTKTWNNILQIMRWWYHTNETYNELGHGTHVAISIHMPPTYVSRVSNCQYYVDLRIWIDTEQAKSNYQDQWQSSSLTHTCVFWPHSLDCWLLSSAWVEKTFCLKCIDNHRSFLPRV